MSGTRPASRSNVVPMPTTTTTTTPPPMPMGWGGTAMPGCAPGGGSGSLMDCYWQIQNATAFISAIMIDAINNNPAVTDAIIAAIEKSGSALPLVGVTDGSAAQPGQVGELFTATVTVPYTTAMETQNVTMGVLPAGDWDCWQYCECTTFMSGVQFILAPVPAGFSNTMQGAAVDTSAQVGTVVNGTAARALISVPTLVVFSLVTNGVGAGPAAGNAIMVFNARRRR